MININDNIRIKIKSGNCGINHCSFILYFSNCEFYPYMYQYDSEILWKNWYVSDLDRVNDTNETFIGIDIDDYYWYGVKKCEKDDIVYKYWDEIKPVLYNFRAESILD